MVAYASHYSVLCAYYARSLYLEDGRIIRSKIYAAMHLSLLFYLMKCESPSVLNKCDLELF